MRKTILLLVVVVVAMSGNQSNAEMNCKFIDASAFESINRKEDVEELISRIIVSQQAEHGRIDWENLLRCFDSLGDRYIVEFYPGGGFEEGDVYRFTVDNSNMLTSFTSVPGASNDIFTAVVNVATNGEVAIVHRGGQLEWLRLE